VSYKCTIFSIFPIRSNVLSKHEWTKFNDILFSVIEDKFQAAMKFFPDMKTFTKIRHYLDQNYDWGWYIWNKNRIPRTREEAENVLPTREVRNSRQEQFKDEIYQKWRSKYNNKNIMSTPEGKERRRMARQKSLTGRRSLHCVRNDAGDTQSQFGTLVGTPDWKDGVSKTNKREYDIMTEAMKQSKVALPECRKELIRLWEAVYAKVNGLTQETMIKWHKSGDLVILQHYQYYEGYAKTICQLKSDCKAALCQQLYSLAEVLPFIFKGKHYTLIDNVEDYTNTPLIATLLAISNYFCESHLFVVPLSSSANILKDIMNEVSKNPLCNVIVNCNYYSPTEPRRFAVATQGVPFISNLTEEEVSTNTYIF
jgi:hypothetical protein